MTNQQIVNAAVANRAVVSANTRIGEDGKPVLPTAAYLIGLAEIAIQSVIGEFILDQSFRRNLLEETYDLTTTSGTTEYDLPSYISRVVGITRGTDSAPLRVFNSRTEYDRWYYSHYGNVTVTSADGPLAVYHSGRSATGKVQITFSPGMGSETTLQLRYIRNLQTPYRVEDMMPEEIHVAVMAGVMAKLVGSAQLIADYQNLKAAAIRALDVMVGGIPKMRHESNIRRKIRRINNMLAGRDSFWPSSVKWVD